MSGKTGRPVIEALAGDKVTLSLRTTATNKGRLVAAAKAGGRNLSEEMERRLEASFRNEAITRRLDRIERALLIAKRPDAQQRRWEEMKQAMVEIAEKTGGFWNGR